MFFKVISKKRGFSMIDLLMYFAAFGILMTVIAPNIKKLWKYVANYKSSSILTNWNQMVKEYYLEQGVYPNRLEDLYERPSDPKVANTWHKYTIINEEKPENVHYNRPPQLFADQFKKYEMFVYDPEDIDNASRDNITVKFGE